MNSAIQNEAHASMEQGGTMKISKITLWPTSLGVEIFFVVIIVVSLILSALFLREVK